MSISNLSLSGYTDNLEPTFKDVQALQLGYKRSISTSLFKPAPPNSDVDVVPNKISNVATIPIDGKSNCYRFRGSLFLIMGAMTSPAQLQFYLGLASNSQWNPDICPQGFVVAETGTGYKLYNFDIIATPPLGTTQLFFNASTLAGTSTVCPMGSIVWAPATAGPGVQWTRMEGYYTRTLN